MGARRRESAPEGDRLDAVVQEILSGLPAGCTWLRPITGAGGRVVDFRVAAASEQGRDVYGRPGTERVDARLSQLYPGMVGGPLWDVYLRAQATGEPGRVADFHYDEKRAGVVATSRFDVRVEPVLGGLLVCWTRIDENEQRLAGAEMLGSLGWAEYDLVTGTSEWSPGMYRVFDRDPALGPMSRADQGAALLPADHGVSETAWQTLDSGVRSDVTVRFRIGGRVKHLRILSDVARDADGVPLKIHAVVQDVTSREDSRSELERLGDALRTREMTALAEHRLAAQLQNLIQPVPAEPFPLAGLEAAVSYLPAESAIQVGGDWYHARDLPDGRVVLAIGDVAGHGLDAATGMAHLRFALIGWLSAGVHGPGELLGHLNGLCIELGVTGTAVIAVYDPPTRALRWARAGHPPPLLARAGRCAALDRPDGRLLGAAAGAAYPVATDRLRVDDLVVFYTDGLVERRTRSMATEVGEVRRALAGASATGGDGMLARVRDALRRPSPYDDTCTLAVRVR